VLACSSAPTIVKNTWTKPGEQAAVYQNIVVYANVSADEAKRRQIEQGVAERLQRDGHATSLGVDVLPEDAMHRTNEELQAILVEAGIDGAIGIRLVSIDDEITSKGWSSLNEAHPVVHVETSGNKKERHVTYEVQTNFFRVSDAERLWTGMSDTVDPTSLDKFIDEYSAVVIDRLLTSGLIVPGTR
jgi:hypothetical protein